MKLKKTLSTILAALMLVSAAAVPALAAEGGNPANANTLDYIDQLIDGLDGLPTDENGIPPVIAPAPTDTAPANDETGYVLTVDGKDKTTVPVMVPLRAVAEALGFTVTWNGDGTITLDSGVMHTVLTLGEDSYQAVTSMESAIGATGPISLGVAPCAVNGVTYVPLQAFDIILGNNAVSMNNGGISINTQEPEGQRPPSPFIPCASMDEAEKLAGFALTAPKGADTIEAWDSYMIQLIYGGEEETMRIRKAADKGDISGDYNEYAQVKTVDGVTIKGEKDAFALAVWEKDGYTFSVNVTEALSQTDMLALVASIK